MVRKLVFAALVSLSLVGWTVSDAYARGGRGCGGCGGGHGGHRHHGCGGCGSSCGGCGGCYSGGCGYGGCGYSGGCCDMGGCGYGGCCDMGGYGYGGYAMVEDADRATLVVDLPADARLTIENQATTSISSTRTFVSPALENGVEYVYTLKAEVTRNGRTRTITRDVTVTAGQQVHITLDLPAAEVASR